MNAKIIHTLQVPDDFDLRLTIETNRGIFCGKTNHRTMVRTQDRMSALYLMDSLN